MPISRYRLNFVSITPIRLPEYAGSAWRGVFGRELKRAVCVTRMPDCRTCLLYRSCPYPYVFETPSPAGAEKMRRYSSVPHPFVIEPDPGAARTIDPGGTFFVDLAIFGRAVNHLPYFVHAFGRAGENGIGTGQGRFSLTGVLQEHPVGSRAYIPILTDGGSLDPHRTEVPAPPELPPEVGVRIDTPLRLKDHDDLVGPKELEFRHFFGSVLRRISMLSYFHTDTPYETDFRKLVDAASAVKLGARRLDWWDWTRYSSRQRVEMHMGGVVGTFEIAGDVTPFWPLLWLGQWTHAGRGASMGLGRYRVGPAASLQAEPGVDE